MFNQLSLCYSLHISMLWQIIGTTPLCIACETGHDYVVKILVENEASLDLKLDVSGLLM